MQGMSEVTTARFIIACSAIITVRPGAEQDARVVRRVQRDPAAAKRQDQEGQHDGQRHPHAELLADDGEDEIGVHLRQVVHLLAAVAEAEPGKAARTERDQRLPLLVARAVLVLGRMQEGHPARHALAG